MMHVVNSGVNSDASNSNRLVIFFGKYTCKYILASIFTKDDDGNDSHWSNLFQPDPQATEQVPIHNKYYRCEDGKYW